MTRECFKPCGFAAGLEAHPAQKFGASGKALRFIWSENCAFS
jgi:hypothetical protein